MPNVLKFGSLNILEPSGPVQASNGIALRLESAVMPTVLGGTWRFFILNLFVLWTVSHIFSSHLDVKVLTLSRLLPPTLQFTTSLQSCPHYYISLFFTVLDIIYSSSNIAKKLTVYIFLTGLCASCFCTVCPVHMVRVRLKMWMGEDSARQYAS